MGNRKFTIKPNETIAKCPKCGNNTEFTAHSEQVCEDGCEIWVECSCGYDPTSVSYGFRLEDVWGSIDEGTILAALDIWNDVIDINLKKT